MSRANAGNGARPRISTGYDTGSDFASRQRTTSRPKTASKILHEFDGISCGLYKHCRAERGQAVSYNYREVLGVLLSFAVKRGRESPRSIPSPGWHSSASPPCFALSRWSRLYGFLDKLRRIVRTSGLLGPRVRETSNAYVLCFPKGLGGLASASSRFHLSVTTPLHQSQTVK